MIISLVRVIPDSNADLISVDFTGTGNFFPAENCSLTMTNARIIFNINFHEPYNKIDVSFNANYTIYNPDPAQNITLAAPFSPDFANLAATCQIEVDNDQKQFVIYKYHWSDPWAEYLDSADLGITDIRNFILTNISCSENASIKLEYNFNAYIPIDVNVDQLSIYYDVGTSRGWNGTITERVEFKTHGRLPNSYSAFSYCTISNFTSGKSYTWEWTDEKINTNNVYVSYYFPQHRQIRYNTIFIVIASFIGVPIIIGVIIKKINRKRRRLRIEDTK